jgi:hypothetical protein
MIFSKLLVLSEMFKYPPSPEVSRDWMSCGIEGLKAVLKRVTKCTRNTVLVHSLPYRAQIFNL